jgi:hypothetical protein
MLNAQAGWAWSNTGRLLQTEDGGNSWVDRTPEGFQYIVLALSRRTDWLAPVFARQQPLWALLPMVANLRRSISGPLRLALQGCLNGWAVSGDLGAGNVYFSLFQTKDGGKTWAPIPVKPQSPEPGLTTGTIHLCNICNDSFYYDPGRLIIVYGDLGSMEPTGSVQMQVSFDLGTTWQTHNLPLPQGEADTLVSPNQRSFR